MNPYLLCLVHCRWILCPVTHWGSPILMPMWPHTCSLDAPRSCTFDLSRDSLSISSIPSTSYFGLLLCPLWPGSEVSHLPKEPWVSLVKNNILRQDLGFWSFHCHWRVNTPRRGHMLYPSVNSHICWHVKHRDFTMMPPFPIQGTSPASFLSFHWGSLDQQWKIFSSRDS